MAKALKTWEDAVGRAARQFNRTCPVDDLTWAREREHVNTVIARSKGLKECLPDTIRQAILQAASMGLSFNPILSHCYMIPRRSRRKRDDESWDEYNKKTLAIAYASPSYRGLSKICIDSGAVLQIRAEVVFEADKFKYRGPIEKPVHEPVLTATHRTQHQCKGAYAICEYLNGSYSTEYVDRATLDAIRSMSDNPGSPMYTSLWTEGFKKIAIRRLCKTVAINSIRLTTATGVMNEHEGVAFEGDVIEGEATVVDEAPVEKMISLDQATELRDLCKEAGLKRTKFMEAYGITEMEQLPTKLYAPAKARIETLMGKARDNDTDSNLHRDGTEPVES